MSIDTTARPALHIESLFELVTIFDEPVEIEPGVTLELPDAGILTVRADGAVVAQVHQGMLHEAVVVFSDNALVRQLLADNSIAVDAIDLTVSDAYEEVPPSAVYLRRMRAAWSSSKPVATWTLMPAESDDWCHIVYALDLAA